MKPPPFLAELLHPRFRANMHVSIRSGFATVASFVVLMGLAHAFHLVALRWELWALVGFKLATNALSALSLRYERYILSLGALNLFADLFCMTGAIYFTGSVESPLFTIYVIEITVVALLTNLGATVLIAATALLLYATMAILVQTGTLPQTPTPVAYAGGITPGYVATAILYATFVLGLPTLYTAAMLQKLREHQRELEKKTELLIEAGRQKSQFMANVTHELRTPIHGICGLSDLVSSGIYGPLSDKQKDAHAGIKRSARSLLALIDDLLAIARSDAGKTELSLSDVDVAELLPSVLATVRWMQGTKPLDLACDVADGLPTLRTDRAKLSQIVLNLLANAVKFTPDGGHVVLRARAREDGVVIEVEDDGIGIAAAELPHIFDEFRQVDGSAERAYGGVGLGLSLARQLAGVIGGTIGVASSAGQGSRFWLQIPARITGDVRTAA